MTIVLYLIQMFYPTLKALFYNLPDQFHLTHSLFYKIYDILKKRTFLKQKKKRRGSKIKTKSNFVSQIIKETNYIKTQNTYNQTLKGASIQEKQIKTLFILITLSIYFTFRSPLFLASPHTSSAKRFD